MQPQTCRTEGKSGAMAAVFSPMRRCRRPTTTPHRPGFLPFALLADCLLVFSGLGCAQPPDGRVWLVDEPNPGGAGDVEALLDRRVEKVDLDGKQFGEAIDLIRKWSGANIYVNWAALQAVGVDKTTTASVKLANVTIRQALEKVLVDVGGVNPLGFVAEGPVLTVSRADDLERYTVTRVYEVGDLAVRPGLSPDARRDIQEMIGQALNRGRDAGSRSETPILVQMNKEEIDELLTVLDDAYLRRGVERLADVIRESVGQESWIDNSGTTGKISIMRNKLVIVQTPRRHKQIASLLAALREDTPRMPGGRTPAGQTGK